MLTIARTTARFLTRPTAYSCRLSSTDATAKSRVPVGGWSSGANTRAALPPAVAALLQDYPAVITIPVQWGEQDVFQHLNNVTYLRYAESGRIAYFDQVLKPHLSAKDFRSFMGNSAIGPIAKSLSCTYRAQVTYPDTITIGMSIRPEHVLKDRFTQTCIMVSHKQERLVAESECLVVTFDYRTQKKAPIPEAILAAWKLGEGIEE